MHPKLQLWETAYYWLRNTNSKLNKNYCRKELTIHPTYPSLISLIDFMDAGQIPYRAVRADSSYIEDFDYPLLAHVKTPGEEYLQIVNNSKEWNKSEELLSYWTGNVIYLESNKSWQNSINLSYVRNEMRSRLIVVALIGLGLTILILSYLNTSSFQLKLYGFLSFLGLITAFFITGAELGFQNEITKQVCGVFSASGCKQVIGSRYAKGYFGITPGDLSVAFFFAQFCLYVGGVWKPALYTNLPLFSFIALPAVIWSIYIQASKIKQWCGLCLIMAFILTSQAILSTLIPSDFNSVLPQFLFPVLFMTGIAILVPFKKMVNSSIANKIKSAEFNNWKLDGTLFMHQWKEELEADTSIWQNDLILGDHRTPLRITVACSTTCGPCAKTHAQLEHLLHKYKTKLHLQIRLLNNPSNDADIRTKTVKAIIQRSLSIKNNDELGNIIADWFNWMDYEKWAAKWMKPNLDGAQDAYVREKLTQHFDWIQQHNIASTPTLFMNGRMIPSRYQLKDVELLIPQLSELVTKEEIEDTRLAY